MSRISEPERERRDSSAADQTASRLGPSTRSPRRSGNAPSSSAAAGTRSQGLVGDERLDATAGHSSANAQASAATPAAASAPAASSAAPAASARSTAVSTVASATWPVPQPQRRPSGGSTGQPERPGRGSSPRPGRGRRPGRRAAPGRFPPHRPCWCRSPRSGPRFSAAATYSPGSGSPVSESTGRPAFGPCAMRVERDAGQRDPLVAELRRTSCTEGLELAGALDSRSQSAGCARGEYR